MNEEKAVRETALAFQSAIADAVAAGYRVNWPGNAAGLDKIEIGSTANAAEQLAKLPQPVDPKRRRPAGASSSAPVAEGTAAPKDF